MCLINPVKKMFVDIFKDGNSSARTRLPTKGNWQQSQDPGPGITKLLYVYNMDFPSVGAKVTLNPGTGNSKLLFQGCVAADKVQNQSLVLENHVYPVPQPCVNGALGFPFWS